MRRSCATFSGLDQRLSKISCATLPLTDFLSMFIGYEITEVKIVIL